MFETSRTAKGTRLSVSLMLSAESLTRLDSLPINDHFSVGWGTPLRTWRRSDDPHHHHCRVVPIGFKFLSRLQDGNLLRPSLLDRFEFLRFRLGWKCPQSNHISEKLPILPCHDHYWAVDGCKWGKVLHTAKIFREEFWLKVTINSAFPVPQGDFKLGFKKEAKSQIPQKFLELALNASFTELLAVVRY